MKYFKITCSNGFVGCEEEFYVSAEDEVEAEDMGVDILENTYSFTVPDGGFINNLPEYEDKAWYHEKDSSDFNRFLPIFEDISLYLDYI